MHQCCANFTCRTVIVKLGNEDGLLYRGTNCPVQFCAAQKKRKLRKQQQIKLCQDIKTFYMDGSRHNCCECTDDSGLDEEVRDKNVTLFQ